MQRPGVDRLLDADPQDRLTVVAAGAGWGKSTAVASWAAAQPGPVGWIALDPRDTVPQALASRVLEALRSSGAVPPDHDLARLRVPPTSTPGFVARWVRGLVSLPEPSTLVLDDLDVVRHRNVVQTVRDLLAADVPLRLVLLSRAEPSLERRTATRVAAEDLAFTAAEVRSLAELEGIEVSPRDAVLILERTRGWPTGVRIALSRLARLQAGDVEAALADALNDDRAVADYLVDEVVDRQAPAVRSFLLRSSVVPTFTPELARALSPSAAPGRLHEALAAAHDFVAPVQADRAALRYHPLLREILHTTLRVRDPAGHQDAHACAARWLLRHGSPVAALDHATEAEHWELLGRVLAEAAAPLLVGPGREAVREVLAQLPYDELPAAEWTELCAAALALVDRAYPACRTHVARARAVRARVDDVPTASDVLTDLFDAASARGLGDVTVQGRAAASAVDALARVEWPFPAYGGYLRSAHELRGSALLWQGDAAGARRELAASVAEEPDVVDFTSLSARAALALAHAALGGLDAAEREAQAAVALAAASGWTSYTYVRPAYAALAWVALLRGRWGDADRAVAYGFAACDAGADPTSLAALQALQVLTALSRGRVRAARAASDGGRGTEPAASLVADLRLRGEVEVEGVTGEGPSQGAGVVRISSPLEALTAGRRSLARADLGGARRHARVAAGWAADLGDPLTETEACLLLAEVAEQRNAARLAEDLVRRAMSVAAPEQLLRPFLCGAGPGARAALRRVLPGRTDALARDVVGRLTTPAPVTEPEPLPSVLTDRELTVLAALPSMASNTEIAEDLVVSVNTVKAHLKSLYRKLDVPTRRAAVARGRELGLLP
ncbi:LuxR C-terminal-related transcriptional regulator [Cellulomonas endometrii]|uniref:LuxR C-terminal-related transcriptional regulator n=1 Tax=Cellulomonas endometrii TaxID=3036301 RepID=UPI0024AD7A10|nr:LuxR C-terminal-related transcriptional regulator [Cellulomonas endometrii]